MPDTARLCRCLLALLAGALCASGQTVVDIAPLYEHAREYDAPIRNVVHLYLRIAGIVWIAVEWFAAIVLVLAFRRLRRVFATEGIAAIE